MKFEDASAKTGIPSEKIMADLDPTIPFNPIGATYGFVFHTEALRDYFRENTQGHSE